MAELTDEQIGAIRLEADQKCKPVYHAEGMDAYTTCFEKQVKRGKAKAKFAGFYEGAGGATGILDTLGGFVNRLRGWGRPTTPSDVEFGLDTRPRPKTAWWVWLIIIVLFLMLVVSFIWFMTKRKK